MRYFSCLLMALVAVVQLSAAEPSYVRVIDPSELPKDIRLAKPVDLDHPAPFQPHFADKAEWEKRAQRLREQILVANGLWPMPPKTPIQPVIHGMIDRDEYVVQKVFFASLPGHYVT